MALAPGLFHAEIDILNFAASRKWTVLEIGATRPVCTVCAPVLQGDSILIVKPLK